MTRPEKANASAATEANAGTQEEAGERRQRSTARLTPRQLSLALVPKPAAVFDGSTIEANDVPRLTGQLMRVHSVMIPGRWHTLGELAARTFQVYGVIDSEAGISARLRDLRKPRWGSHQVHRRRREGALWEYQLEERP